MARKPRQAPGSGVYHVLNRSAGKFTMFRGEKDHLAFENTVAEALERHPLRVLAYCVMNNHWHFVVWPERDGQVSAFFRWLTLTHAMRWRVAHRTVGYGSLYASRFRTFPVQPRGENLRAVCRYVERNALTAGLVERAEDWRWGSLWTRLHGTEAQRALLSDWPEPIPGDWLERVNRPLTSKEIDRIAPSLKRGRPFGDPAWTADAVDDFGLAHTLRSVGRPAKQTTEQK